MRVVLGASVLLGGLATVAGPAVAAAAAAGEDTAAVARANRRSESEVRQILDDPSAKVGATDRIYFDEPLPQDPPGTSARKEAATVDADPAQTFVLHSRPGSTRVIYLDFDGHTVTGTAWNSQTGRSSFDAAPFSLDPWSDFSIAEHEVVQSVWQRVAEDFSPFDVDVTTQDPGEAAITRSGWSDQRFGTRALVTNTSVVASTCGCSGTAFFGAFAEPDQHAFLQPALVFSLTLGGHPKLVAEAVSHEVGHNLNLRHDGSGDGAYYNGHGFWSPIMGFGARPVSQWSKGEYAGATNTQDDLLVIQESGAPLLPDDHGNTAATATPAVISGTTASGAGIITSDADVDVFRVRAPPGTAAFSASPAANSPNLDVLLELRSVDGALVGSNDRPSTYLSFDQASGLDAAMTVALPTAGDYLLFVSGVGTGDPGTGYSGYGSVGRYTVKANLRVPTVGLVSSLNPSTVRQPVSFTASVTMPPPGSGSPTGTVTFNDGTRTLCRDVPLSAGRAGCTTPVGAGNRAITAVYNGDAAFSPASAALSQVVDGDPVTVAIASSPRPSASGEPVTIRAVVAQVAADAGLPSGPVTFSDGATVLCADVALEGGQAACTVPVAAGDHPLTAVYRGDDWFNGQSSPVLAHQTSRVATTLELVSYVNPSVSGQGFWMVAKIAPVPPGGGGTRVGGTVTIRNGSTALCTAAVHDTLPWGSCWVSFTVGSHAITAEYSGDAERAGSTAPVLTQTVNRGVGQVEVVTYPATTSSGENVRIEARVTPRAPAGFPATGTVSFSANGTVLCTGVEIRYGTANCNRSLTTGTYDLVATYGGDVGLAGAASPPLGYTVTPPAVSVSLSSSSNPVARGVPVTLTASVAPVVSGSSTPTGTVTFHDGDTALCGAVALSSRRATCTVPFGAGTRPLRAVYSGSATFSGATSPVLNQTVTGDTATATIAASLSSSVSGQPVAFRATVAGSAPDVPAPTGTVTFTDGGTALCTGVPLTAGAATCSVAMPAGDHLVTAAYNGDDRFNGVTSAALSHGVGRALTSVAVTSSHNPVIPTWSPLLSATVSVAAPGSRTPTGTVTFKEGETVLCAAVALPSASCLSHLPPGTHPVTAVYSGDGQTEGATSAVFEQVVLGFGGGFTAVTPRRLLDTRTGLGDPTGGGPLVGRGGTRGLVVRGGASGIPASASTVVLNVTVTAPSANSYLTVAPTNAASPDTSNLNFSAGQTIANLVVVGSGPDGGVAFTNAYGSVHVIADIVGYHTPVGGTTSTTVTPTRLLDTRFGTGGPAGPIGPGATRELPVRGGSTGIPETATAVIVNMTVTGPSAAGYLTVHPSGVARPTASNLNFVAGQTIPNLAMVGIGSGGRISIFNAAGNAHVLADVVGYYSPSGGSTFVGLPAKRLLDTRSGVGGLPTPIGAGAAREVLVATDRVGIPETATGVVLNVTAAFPTAASYLTVYPADVARPTSSNLNFSAGQIIPNLVVVGIGRNGTISIFNGAGTTHVVADVVGYTR